MKFGQSDKTVVTAVLVRGLIFILHPPVGSQDFLAALKLTQAPMGMLFTQLIFYARVGSSL